ncbi:MAG: aldo/keto reductase [Candidatus Nanopelagicaceae bacterium]|nr:aldo/keto reductase [Candidatus Nanopelagicaceae bacterium]
MITLPKTDLTVHPLCLGGNVFGFSADVANSEVVLDYYFDNGGNFIDTADMYSQWAPGHVGGESETIIGNWMKRRGNRSKMVIATKVAKLDTRPGLKPANIAAACDESLKRLQTDYIDLYYAHQDDPDTPIEDTLTAFDSLIKAGKVRYIAASNFTAERLQQSLDIAKQMNLSSYVACQDQYNLMDRDYETTLMPTLKANGLSQIPFYGLARGFLTGKYRPGVTVESVRATGVANSYANDRGWKLLEKLDQIAKDHNTSVAAVSLAWLRAQPTVATPIASATKLEQIKELMPVIELTSDQLALLTNS